MMRKALAAVGAVLMVVLLGGSAAQAGPGWWTPPTKVVSWQWQLSGTVDTSVNASVFDIDSADNTAMTVAKLHAKGSKVVCYLDVGAAESYRSDYAALKAITPSVLGNSVGGWPAERYLDIRRITALAPVMLARLDMCVSKSFDAIEMDLDDTALDGGTGFPLTMADQVAYDSWLASAAHARGLAVFAKNGADATFVAALVSKVDGAINEQCVQYSECGELAGYGQAGKPVLHVEYSVSLARTCAPDRVYPNFTSMKKTVSLTAVRTVCP